MAVSNFQITKTGGDNFRFELAVISHIPMYSPTFLFMKKPMVLETSLMDDLNQGLQILSNVSAYAIPFSLENFIRREHQGK